MKLTAITFLFSILLWSCNSNPNPGVYSGNGGEDVNTQEEVTMEPENKAPENYNKGGISITPFKGFKKYDNASLRLNEPRSKQVVEQNKVNFDFTVNNYQLGEETPDASEHPLANSDKGQHIHLIVDNRPYSAHYTNKFSKEYEDGTHYAIAFLSRSYHLSVKNKKAYRVFQFTVNEAEGADPKLYPIDEPMLFYSRPKGTYTGKDAEKILFDFYLHETTLKEDGHSVLMKVNDSLSFEIDNWQPYIIEGLPMGENTISIELVDAQGRPVNPEVNHISRTFTLES